VVLATVALKYGTLSRVRLPGALIAVSIVAFALLTTVYDPTPRITTTSETPGGSSPETQVDSADRKFRKITQSSTVRLRLQYWELSGEIALERPEIPYTNNFPTFIRWSVGYDPDTYRFVATAAADTLTFTGRFTAAHNDPINRLVE
jgi:hypothetical protein